jgi:hypothetical protein
MESVVLPDFVNLNFNVPDLDKPTADMRPRWVRHPISLMVLFATTLVPGLLRRNL